LARRSYEWVDDDTIAALVVPEGRGLPPPRPPAPIGPSIQDNTDGRTSQVPANLPPCVQADPARPHTGCEGS